MDSAAVLFEVAAAVADAGEDRALAEAVTAVTLAVAVATARGTPRRGQLETVEPAAPAAGVAQRGDWRGARLEGSLVLAPNHLNAAFMAVQAKSLVRSTRATTGGGGGGGQKRRRASRRAGKWKAAFFTGGAAVKGQGRGRVADKGRLASCWKAPKGSKRGLAEWRVVEKVGEVGFLLGDVGWRGGRRTRSSRKERGQALSLPVGGWRLLLASGLGRQQTGTMASTGVERGVGLECEWKIEGQTRPDEEEEEEGQLY